MCVHIQFAEVLAKHDHGHITYNSNGPSAQTNMEPQPRVRNRESIRSDLVTDNNTYEVTDYHINSETRNKNNCRPIGQTMSKIMQDIQNNPLWIVDCLPFLWSPLLSYSSTSSLCFSPFVRTLSHSTIWHLLSFNLKSGAMRASLVYREAIQTADIQLSFFAIWEMIVYTAQNVKLWVHCYYSLLVASGW